MPVGMSSGEQKEEPLSRDRVQPSNTPTIMALVVMTAITVAGIVAVTLIRPEQDNNGIITQILAIMIPTTAALAAFLKSVQAAQSSERVEQKIDDAERRTGGDG